MRQYLPYSWYKIYTWHLETKLDNSYTKATQQVLDYFRNRTDLMVYFTVYYPHTSPFCINTQLTHLKQAWTNIEAPYYITIDHYAPLEEDKLKPYPYNGYIHDIHHCCFPSSKFAEFVDTIAKSINKLELNARLHIFEDIIPHIYEDNIGWIPKDCVYKIP